MSIRDREYVTTSGGPFSYIGWLPQDYPAYLPCWGARLIINYNYGRGMGPHSLSWVWDRKTSAGPTEAIRKEFMARASDPIQDVYDILSLPENGRMIETEDPNERQFRRAALGQGVEVFYMCAHGYCHLVAVEAGHHT
jgi:hypothetical protein